MAVPPDLNSPEQQQAYIEEQERQKQQAAALEAERNKPTGYEGSVANFTGDIVTGAGDAVDDFFSAEQVSGPGKGSWGQAGTPAASYNASAVSKGLTDQQNFQAQGAQAANSAGKQSTNLLGQAGYAGTRNAPVTNYAGADQYASKADSARNFANNLVNEAGSSAQQDAQLAALNNFANRSQGPSAAQAQLAQSTDAAQRGALSMARSGRGAGDSASSLRDAMFSNAETQARGGQAAAGLRAQEDAAFQAQRLQALESAMGGAGAIRGADVNAAQVAQGTRSQDLQAQQQAAGQAQFNTTTQQNQTQLNDAAKQGLINSALGFTSEGNQTNLGFNQLGSQAQLGNAQLGQNALNAQADYELAQQQMELDAQKANQQADLEKDSGVSGMVAGAAGALFGLSDERAKDLEKRERSLAAALETVGNAPGYSYRYKDPSQPGAKSGRMVGPMAQDIERGPLGDTIVKNTEQGKMVDQGRLEMVNTSAITELNHKVDALERALGKRRAA